MLTNLIDNAVKYSPRGRRGRRQRAAARTAPCASPSPTAARAFRYDQQRLIFEKFGRAEVRGGGSKPGTGLGLFIARSIAEAHGGTLDVRSPPGEGATFIADAAALRLDAQPLDAELFRELARARGDAGAQLGGLEHDRLAALREDLALEPLVAADRDLAQRAAVRRACARRARSRSARSPACRGRARSSRRAAASARSPRAARTSPSAASRCASGRAGTSARRRSCGPTCARTSAAARARTSTPRRAASTAARRPPSGTRSRRAGARRGRGRASRSRSSSSVPCTSALCASSNSPNVSSSFLRTLSSGRVRVGGDHRPDVLEREPDRARLERRQPRRQRGTCRPRAPCRRARRRRVSSA